MNMHILLGEIHKISGLLKENPQNIRISYESALLLTNSYQHIPQPLYLSEKDKEALPKIEKITKELQNFSALKTLYEEKRLPLFRKNAPQQYQALKNKYDMTCKKYMKDISIMLQEVETQITPTGAEEYKQYLQDSIKCYEQLVQYYQNQLNTLPEQSTGNPLEDKHIEQQRHYALELIVTYSNVKDSLSTALQHTISTIESENKQAEIQSLLMDISNLEQKLCNVTEYMIICETGENHVVNCSASDSEAESTVTTQHELLMQYQKELEEIQNKLVKTKIALAYKTQPQDKSLYIQQLSTECAKFQKEIQRIEYRANFTPTAQLMIDARVRNMKAEINTRIISRFMDEIPVQYETQDEKETPAASDDVFVTPEDIQEYTKSKEFLNAVPSSLQPFISMASTPIVAKMAARNANKFLQKNVCKDEKKKPASKDTFVTAKDLQQCVKSEEFMGMIPPELRDFASIISSDAVTEMAAKTTNQLLQNGGEELLQNGDAELLQNAGQQLLQSTSNFLTTSLNAFSQMLSPVNQESSDLETTADQNPDAIIQENLQSFQQSQMGQLIYQQRGQETCETLSESPRQSSPTPRSDCAKQPVLKLSKCQLRTPKASVSAETPTLDSAGPYQPPSADHVVDTSALTQESMDNLLSRFLLLPTNEGNGTDHTPQTTRLDYTTSVLRSTTTATEQPQKPPAYTSTTIADTTTTASVSTGTTTSISHDNIS